PIPHPHLRIRRFHGRRFQRQRIRNRAQQAPRNPRKTRDLLKVSLPSSTSPFYLLHFNFPCTTSSSSVEAAAAMRPPAPPSNSPIKSPSSTVRKNSAASASSGAACLPKPSFTPP